MPRRSSEPDDSFTLPTAFARLDSDKLVADLRHLISPRNFPWALQLTRRYFTLAIAWERDHPGTPLAVYRTDGQLRNRAAQLPQPQGFLDLCA